MRKDGRHIWVEIAGILLNRDQAESLWTFVDITERNRVESELARERAYLKTLISTIPELIWWKDTDGRYLGCNSRFEQFFGAREADIRGKTDYDFVPRELADLFRQHDRLAMEKNGPSVNEEEVTFANDGHSELLETTKTPLRDENGRLIGVLGISHDISERKRTEMTLRELEERYSKAFHTSPDAININRVSDGLYIEANDSFLLTMGYSRSEVIGRTSLELDIWVDPVARAQLVKRLTEYGYVRDFEGQFRKKDGGAIWGLMSASRIELHGEQCILSISRDISERKRAEQAILDIGQRYQALLSSSLDGVWVVDLDGRLLEVNDAYCRQSGYGREELLTMHVTQLDIDDDPEAVNARIRKVVGEGGAIFESRHQRKDGSIWAVEASLGFAPIQGGRLFCFFRDITERNAEEQLRNLHQRLADMAFTEDQKQLLQTALDTAERLTESQIGFFHFVENDEDSVSLQTWSTRTLGEMCQAKGEGLHYPVSEAGVWSDCIRARQPVIHNDYSSLPHKKGMPEGHSPLIRELTVPVFRKDRIVAVMGVGNKKQNYDDHDVYLVTKLADIALDFVERKQAEQQIQFMAFNDVLTRLPNRQLFADRLKQAIALARRNKKLLAICYLDLDGFKSVNDHYGHQTGDQLLVQLAKRLPKGLRDGDTLARLGGDEFVILLNDLGSIFNGEEILERLLQSIAQPYEVGGHRVHISASIGVTYFPNDDSDPDTLLRHADHAMYMAKNSGKNTFRLYDPIQDQKAHTFSKTIKEFEEALHQSQLVVHYQPRIDLRSGELAGVEALVRWQHPEKGLLYPDQFLPLIENSSLEIALDEWVLKAALDQHMAWREQGLTVPVSVNITPQHIQQAEFPAFLAKQLAAYPEGMARYLELEVLETSAIGDTVHVAEIMNACAKLGVEFSLDDFGTGYSSLTHFHHLPIGILKIDQHFVRDMMIDSRDQDIVEGVLQLAKALKRPVVAEGVENIELGMMLASLRCQFAQGYGIARPMLADSLPVWSRQWRDEHVWHRLHLDINGSPVRYDLNVAIFSHRQWVTRVVQYLESGLTKDRPGMSATTCQFSVWYHGIGAARYGQTPSYPLILVKHDAVHRIADELVKIAEDQGPAEARTRIDELVAAGEALVVDLNKLSEG